MDFEQTISGKAKRVNLTIDRDGVQRLEVAVVAADGTAIYTRNITVGADGTVKVLLPDGNKALLPPATPEHMGALADLLGEVDAMIGALASGGQVDAVPSVAK